ncbi:hypothetical protein J0X14_01885 [Muricauda sp. CAU 1633]|uniref:hypothetical protein n=1 Tax=Allomuricauda sp. CAU 1633 TaxID=2816036 RepID=UPI001A8EEF38|nr:hypothetical protein [Muricauda sp. CAU 1633]MBO0321030.1 hypothetical protein [Muricauda sp. CAU 1633]
MIYTIITLTIVSLVLLFWLYKLMQYCFFRPFSLWKSQKNSSVPAKEATILSVNTLRNGKFPLLEVDVLFENFSGYPIQRKMRFVDKKPHLNRFKKDGAMRILLDAGKKPGSPIFPETGEYRISMAQILFYSILTMAYVSGCYFLMGEAISRVSASPNRYEAIFANSTESGETFFIVVLVAVFLYFVFRRIGLLPSKKSKSLNWDLLYHGLGVTATVKEYKDTGTLINDNPVVRFIYTYPDQRGQIIEGSDKKVVGKLEIVGLPDMHELEIMYLPTDSHISRLTENLQKENFSVYANSLILFSLLLFSIFFIVGFCKDLF